IVTVTGTAGKTDVNHTRVAMSRTAVTIGTPAKIATINTAVAPALGVNADTGALRLIVRVGSHEPGLNPRDASFSDSSDGYNLTPDPPDDPQAGFALAAAF